MRYDLYTKFYTSGRIRLNLAGVLTLTLLFYVNILSGQSLSDLQQKRQAAVKEIELTNKLLNQVQQQEKASVNRLQLINNNIKQRNQVIAGLNSEIKLYGEFIANNQLVVDLFKDDLESMKAEYARLIRFTYLTFNSNNPLLFLLSADNFNQAYRRLLYMKQYTSVRTSQVEAMNNLQQLMNQKIEQLDLQRQTRKQLLEQTREEAEKLAQEQKQQSNEVQNLKSQQRDLRQKLEQQRKAEQLLENEIQRIIEEEASKKRAAGKPAYGLTPEQKLVGDNFAQNRLRLPWPVERGVITERFGIHRHPVLEKVQIRNNGINIATEPGAKARAVFKGEVTRVFGITGGNSAIIIRHGSYLSVYSNLREVTVKTGDNVRERQPIGTVYTDTDDGNKTILKFQIWHENQKLNPEDWLGK
ncbi:MAG TPA: peptidoglycan DD-metalloendopeptidase family protein [Mariniphaga sp.]|nr:peptidoglycan DD-metalloendopeptidase family protein [Mariniphaga sp.]